MKNNKVAAKFNALSTKKKVAVGVVGVGVLAAAFGGGGEAEPTAPAPTPEPTQAVAEYPRADLTVEEVADIVDGEDPHDTAHVEEVLDAAAVTGEGGKYVAIQFRNSVGEEEAGVWLVGPDYRVAADAEAEVNSNLPPARDVIGMSAVDGDAAEAAKDAMDGTFDAAAVAPMVAQMDAEDAARVAEADAELEQAARDAAVEDLAETFRMIDEAAAKAAEEAGN